MSRLLLTLLVGLALASLPVAAQAADGKDHGLLLRVNGDVTVAKGESVSTVVVVDGDLVVDGDVREGLVVVHGNAVITGTVQGAVTVIDGDLSLRRGSSVEDVNLVRSTLHRDEGATLTGKINHRQNFVFRGAWAIFTVLFWVGMTIAVLVSGLLFAAVGGRQLTTAARALTGEVGQTILGALLFWIAVPVLAVLLFVTVVGIPLGPWPAAVPASGCLVPRLHRGRHASRRRGRRPGGEGTSLCRRRGGTWGAPTDSAYSRHRLAGREPRGHLGGRLAGPDVLAGCTWPLRRAAGTGRGGGRACRCSRLNRIRRR